MYICHNFPGRMHSPQTLLDLSEGEGGSIDELAGKEAACEKHRRKANRN